MYTKAEFDSMEKYKHAEISTSNIDAVLLKMMHYGMGRTTADKIIDILSNLIEPPAKPRVAATFKYLEELGVLTSDGKISPTGMCVYKLNVDIPVALFLVACRRENIDVARALTHAECGRMHARRAGFESGERLVV
jgi:HrpA-like RNA helicase